MKKIINRYSIIIYFILSLIIASILTTLIFQRIGNNQFLFIHDEFLILSLKEANSLLFLRSQNDLGISSVTNLLVTFYDQVYYLLMYGLGLSLHTIQLILYFLKFFIIVFVPFIGIKKLARLYLKEDNNPALFLVSLWYSFNPFTLLHWNGSFSLTTLIFYSCAPLCLYFYHKAVIEEGKFKYKLLAAVFLFLLSFLIYLFAVFLIILVIYTFLHMIIKKNVRVRLIMKNIIQTILLALPLFSIFIVLAFDFTRSSIVSPTSFVGETAGNIGGGFLYPIILWFSWGIYNVWEPRNIQTFYKYFSSPIYILSVFVLYGLIIKGLLRNKSFYSLIFVSILLVLLLFVKGPQSPFGEIYTFFINHVPLFILFRSPDNKFGFGIIFILTLLIILASNHYNKKNFIFSMLLITLIQSYPLFTGIAIWGENTKHSWDRIISISQQEKEVAKFINARTVPNGYIMPFPTAPYAQYWLEKNKLFIGQDLLPKLSDLPFIYLEKYSVLPFSTYTAILRSLKDNDVARNTAPIKYFLLRNDIRNTPVDKTIRKLVTTHAALVYKTNTFEIYKNNNAAPLLYGDNNISYTLVNPVTYNIHFENVTKPANLYFNQNYNKDWKLFITPTEQNACSRFFTIPKYNTKECNGHFSRFSFQDLKYIFAKPLFDPTHTLLNGYANAWKISPKDLHNAKYITTNKDGSVNFTLTLYYQPQSYLYAGIITTLVFLIVYTFLIFTLYLKHAKTPIRRK